jgi:1-aminocyclopropane-1-carboxylate deaminase
MNAYQSSGNVQLTELLGAEIMPIGSDQAKVMKQLEKRGEKPYFIAGGSSLHEKGGLGYVNWAYDVVHWEKEHGVHFDTILVANAGGSTLAGMVAGFKSLELESSSNAKEATSKRRLIGIEAFANEGDATFQQTLVIAKGTAKLIGLEETQISPNDFITDKRFNAGAYGKCDEKTLEAVQLMAQLEGVIMDPVYTGKMTAGLVHMIRSGEITEGDTVLVVHTGGQTSLIGAYPNVR